MTSKPIVRRNWPTVNLLQVRLGLPSPLVDTWRDGGYNYSVIIKPTPALQEGGDCVSDVRASDNEPFESLLKRFAKKVQADGILAEVRRREHYEKPSVRRKKKEAAKRRKSMKGSG